MKEVANNKNKFRVVIETDLHSKCARWLMSVNLLSGDLIRCPIVLKIGMW